MPPVIAVVGAVSAVSAGVAAIGAGSLLVGGAMIAGGVMTGLGVLTGSEKLQKFGGLLSLAGGVAGLASGAWEKTAAEVAKAASPTQALGQTANVTPIAEGAAAADASSAFAGASPTNGFGVNGVPSGPAAEAASTSLQNPLRVQEMAAGVAQPAASSSGGGIINAARKGWDFVTDPKNAKAVEVGSGIVSGALKYAFPSALDKAKIAQMQYEQLQRDRLNSSIMGSGPTPFTANPNAQLFTQSPVDATNRFVPSPGLVNSAVRGA